MNRTFLFVALLIFSEISWAQTIRRVTNLPGAATGVNTYSTIIDAMTAASSGDTIYIEPSATGYEGFNVTKTLHFIGNGNFLAQNPNTPYEKSSSTIEGRVYFDAGSSNSTATGIYFENRTDLMNSSGVQIKRCRFSNGIVLNANTSNILLAESMIVGDVSGTSINTSAQNVMLRNNIISGKVNYLKNSTIDNNTIYYYYKNTVTDNPGSTITDNIMDHRDTKDILVLSEENTGSTISNNLQIASATATLPETDENNNKFTSNFNNIFVVAEPWVAVAKLKDADFKLIEGSLAKGMGTKGTDAGAFGDTHPYTLSGLPNIPIITSAESSTTGTNAVPLSVTISVRSN
jgi:hypothetical protein